MTGRFERLRFMVPIVGGMAVGTAGFALAGFRLNLTASFPPGLYRVAVDGPLAAICLDGAAAQLAGARGYIRSGVCPGGLEPLMKRVVAQAGDVVEVSAGGVTVNGRLLENSAPRMRDSQGRPMPVLPGLPDGRYRLQLSGAQVWLASSFNAGSFDSRYFGPVSAGQIKERLTPVCTASMDRSW